MKTSIFKTFLLSLCIVANTHLAYAQTASILPPAKTQYLDNNGKPLTSGKVFNYIPSTTTFKTTWQDAAETIPNTNPVILDAGGRAKILGDGSYRQIVKDRYDNVIWDAVTSSTGTSSGGSTATGDGDLVGTIKPWAGTTAPNQYAFTYGQEVSRTTYAILFTAITSSQSTFCNSGSPTLSGLSDTTNFWIGMSLEISCVAAGFSTVASKTSTTVTMAANANVTTNTTAIFFPWGRGNGTTTFNLPDFRGFAIAGNNNMGGVASSILTTTYFGATNPNSIGASGGNQSTTLLPANLPPHTHTSSTLTDPGHTHTLNGSVLVAGATIGGGALISNTTGTAQSSTTGITISANTGTNASGTSDAFSRVSPYKTSNYIIKITPDANSATASGVTSIQGMTGDIACGTGLTCTGNIISANVTTANPTSNITLTTINGVASTAMRSDAAPALSQAISPTWTGNHTFTPSSGFATVTNGKSQVYNTFASAVPDAITGAGVYFETQSGGAGLTGTGPISGGYSSIIEGTAGSLAVIDKIGWIGSCLIIVNDAAGGGCYGLNSTAIVTGTGAINRLVGHEADMEIRAGGSANYRYAYSAVNASVGQATIFDAAYMAGNFTAISGAFKCLLCLTNSLGFAPIDPTGKIFGSDTAYTIDTVLDVSNATITSWLWNHTNSKMSGNGEFTSVDVKVTGGPATITTGQGTIGASANSGLIFKGHGAIQDMQWINNLGGTVCVVATGTTTLNCNTITIANALGVASGGLGTTSGTSGGVPYYSSATTTASSALLTNNALMTGGGAAAAPKVLGSLGTTTTVLHGNAAGPPTFGAVDLTADVTGILPIANGGMGNAAWTSFTPTFTCGTGVFTTASATRMTVGKTTFIQFDTTLSTLGSCTTPFTFTLPTTPQSGGALMGLEATNTSSAISCQLTAASATATCRKNGNVAAAVNDRHLVTAVYTNQ